MEDKGLQEKFKDDILKILLKLRIEDLELLKARFQASEEIDEAIRIKREEGGYARDE